jgi:hypothetical protein
MQTAIKSAAANPKAGQAKPHKLLKRIGSTSYEVSIHFSQTSKETVEDKILRLIRREAENLPLNVPQISMAAGTEEL